MICSCKSVLGSEECTDFILWPLILWGNDPLYVEYWEKSAELQGDEASGQMPLANFGSNGP